MNIYAEDASIISVSNNEEKLRKSKNEIIIIGTIRTLVRFQKTKRWLR